MTDAKEKDLSENEAKLDEQLVAMGRSKRPISWSVVGSAAIVAILLIVFFATVLHSTSTINSQILYMKDGLFPISEDTGSIDTNLVRIRTIVEGMSTTEVTQTTNDSAQVYAKAIDETVTTLRKLSQDIDVSYLRDPKDFNDFKVELSSLDAKLHIFETICFNSDTTGIESYEERSEYIGTELNPLLDSLIDRNLRVLSETNETAEEMYSRVSTAINSLVTLTIILIIGISFFTAVFVAMLVARTRIEEDLSKALREAYAEAQAANQAKSQFLSNISHDIRTPMNAIVGLIQIADEHIDDPMRVRQCLTRISTSSQHLLSLINDVLDMNKIESGKVNLVNEGFSLKGVMHQIETIVYAQPTTAMRDCKIEMDDIKYDRFVGDAMRLRQVLLNLTSNALKYTNEGDRVRFVVSEPRTYGEANHPSKVLVRFVVEDTGIGMSEEFIENIFEPFEREKNDYTTFTEGTGLGMAITKRLVDVMGGTIDIQSALGVGTTITVDIVFKVDPLANGNGDELDESASTVPVVDFAAGEKVKGCVLIVEDNEINMEIARTLIGSRGAEVESASDGLEAVVKVSDAPEGHYDLIFMDWQMPHMDGLEATRQIRSFQHDHGRNQIPIVAMTANAFDSNRKEALEAGMDDFLSKPINMHELEEMLSKYLIADFGIEAQGRAAASEDRFFGDSAGEVASGSDSGSADASEAASSAPISEGGDR